MLLGARVAVTPVPSGIVRERTVNDRGAFTVSGLPSGGQLLLTATLDGYRFVPQIVEADSMVDGVVIIGVPEAP